MLTDQEVLAQHDDAEMIRRDHLWPHLNLPLKRSREGGYDVAVVTAVGENSGSVYVIENMTIFGPLGKVKPKIYDSVEAVLRDGWRVD